MGAYGVETDWRSTGAMIYEIVYGLHDLHAQHPVNVSQYLCGDGLVRYL